MKAFAVLLAVAAALSCLHTRAASPGKNTLEVAFMPTQTFPHELSQRGVREGEADVIVSISPNGRAADWLVTACTDPAFEKMLAELLPALEFKLSTSKDLTGPVRVSLRFLFESTGVVVSHTASDSIDNILNRIATPRRIEKLGTPRQLDRAPTLQHTVAPLYPEDLNNTAGARVTLEFLIDQNGRVRMPVLHDGENQLLANAAATALLDWRFDPPTRGGKPVIVAARQEFVLPPR
jgi:outer membrane biosynthesis protein TonB